MITHRDGYIMFSEKLCPQQFCPGNLVSFITPFLHKECVYTGLTWHSICVFTMPCPVDMCGTVVGPTICYRKRALANSTSRVTLSHIRGFQYRPSLGIIAQELLHSSLFFLRRSIGFHFCRRRSTRQEVVELTGASRNQKSAQGGWDYHVLSASQWSRSTKFQSKSWIENYK